MSQTLNVNKNLFLIIWGKFFIQVNAVRKNVILRINTNNKDLKEIYKSSSTKYNNNMYPIRRQFIVSNVIRRYKENAEVIQTQNRSR